MAKNLELVCVKYFSAFSVELSPIFTHNKVQHLHCNVKLKVKKQTKKSVQQKLY